MNLEQTTNRGPEEIITNESIEEVVPTEIISEEDKQAKIELRAQREKENDEQIEKVRKDLLRKFEGEKIKEGVNFVFEQNPELSKIGTPVQYSEYLDTVFPDSKVKDIVYHGTHRQFDEFKFTGAPRGNFIDNLDFAKAWAKEKVEFQGEGNPNVYAMKVNITNLPDNENNPFDGAVRKYENDGPITGNEIEVYKEENIHILGSKQDIEKFKEFVSKTKLEQAVV